MCGWGKANGLKSGAVFRQHRTRPEEILHLCAKGHHPKKGFPKIGFLHLLLLSHNIVLTLYSLLHCRLKLNHTKELRKCIYSRACEQSWEQFIFILRKTATWRYRFFQLADKRIEKRYRSNPSLETCTRKQHHH